MTQIIGMSGAHATGKSSTLEAIKNHLQSGAESIITVDTFKVSRTVLKASGLSLEEATATSESTKLYQTRVLDAAYRHLYLIKLLPTETIHLVDRTVADIYAYTRLWCEKNGIESEWLEGFKCKCIEMLPLYDKIFLFPVGVFAYVDDGVRAKEDTQKVIAKYTEEFLHSHYPQVFVVTESEISNRAKQIMNIVIEQ